MARGRVRDPDYGGRPVPDWRTVDWSRHERRTRVAGAELGFADIGDGPGPAVVFIHGLGGNWRNWLQTLPAVARERRAVAVDLPGFGASAMPPGEVSISGFARAVDELCEQLELGSVAVVGNS